MFDIIEFMSAPVVDETAVVKRGTEEFKIRRMNGAERLKFNDLKDQYDRVRFALGRCLLSGTNGTPIGEANAARMLERCGALCEALFNDIYELTRASLEKESELWEEAKKN